MRFMVKLPFIRFLPFSAALCEGALQIVDFKLPITDSQPIGLVQLFRIFSAFVVQNSPAYSL
jgi:hypothetical protein